jgi:hypothetical protein
MFYDKRTKGIYFCICIGDIDSGCNRLLRHARHKADAVLSLCGPFDFQVHTVAGESGNNYAIQPYIFCVAPTEQAMYGLCVCLGVLRCILSTLTRRFKRIYAI